MIGNFKNINFSFVKISGGSSVINTDMTDKKFYASKPIGYYRVFSFPITQFEGYDYFDLQDFVRLEMESMWDKTNRNTFLGYDKQTNTFICNINAYIGLKDSDLKTDGQLPHSGQVGWYYMELSTTKSGSIITLKQEDGSDIYLKIKDPVYTSNFSRTSGQMAVEYKKQRIANSSVFKKENALWCKSSEDNSIVMVMDNLPNSSVGRSPNIYNYSYATDNKLLLGTITSAPTLGNYNLGFQSLMYGKPAVAFDTRIDEKPVTISGFYAENCLKNNTGKDIVEYTETSDLTDILQSGESLLFSTQLKSKYNRAMADSGGSFRGQKCEKHYQNIPVEAGIQIKPATYLEPKISGASCDLISMDPKNKPFLYSPSYGDILIYGTKSNRAYIDITNFLNNLPDGFIAIALLKTSTNPRTSPRIYRFKKGESAKYKTLTGTDNVISISDTTQFGIDLYDGLGVKKTIATIPKDDVINATGFSSLPFPKILSSTTFSMHIVVTIMRI